MTREEVLAVYSRHLAAEQDAHAAAAAAANYAATIEAMPDIRFDIDGETVDGNWLVHWGTMIGTVTGSYLGQPPTGRPVRLPFLARFEFGDGVIQGEQIWFDSATLCDQAGIDRQTLRRHHIANNRSIAP
jgi:predicted ester cyclase